MTLLKRRRPVWLAMVAVTAVTILTISLVQAFATTPPLRGISIDISSAARTTTLTLSTNLQSGGDLLPPGVLPALAAWNPPMVRLHLGFRPSSATDTPILPDAVYGHWDFTAMDALLSSLRAKGITYFLNVRTAPPWMFDQRTGQLPDSSFAKFASYMVDLVDWYNKGGFTDNQGIFHASGHYHWIPAWEIWNEPKSGWDIPAPIACRSCAPWMTAPRYARLYDLVATAMRHADPTIAVGGPAINSWPDMPYLATFMHDETAKLDFFSLHFYGATSAQEPDQLVFASIYGPRFAQRLAALRTIVPASIPLWVDELNINEASSATDIDPRGTSPVIYPFLAASLTTAMIAGVSVVDQFNLLSDQQFGLINSATNTITRPYWFCRVFAQQFPAGSHLLHIAVPGGISLLAVITPDGRQLHILIGNVMARNAADVNGPGLAQMVHLALTGAWDGRRIDTAHHSTLWTFDAASPVTTLPSATNVTLQSAAGGTTVALPLPGDSALILSIPLI